MPVKHALLLLSLLLLWRKERNDNSLWALWHILSALANNTIPANVGCGILKLLHLRWVSKPGWDERSFVLLVILSFLWQKVYSRRSHALSKFSTFTIFGFHSIQILLFGNVGHCCSILMYKLSHIDLFTSLILWILVSYISHCTHN